MPRPSAGRTSGQSVVDATEGEKLGKTVVQRLVDSGIVSMIASDSRCAIEGKAKMALRRSLRSEGSEPLEPARIDGCWCSHATASCKIWTALI